MRKIGITVYEPVPKFEKDAQLQYQIVDDNGTVTSGRIVQSRVFELRDDQTIQFRADTRLEDEKRKDD